MINDKQLKKRTEPTEAQKKAGNYFKPRVNIAGLEIAIENPVGTVRTGINSDGSTWATKMHNHYGYVAGSLGADGDEVDVYLGNNADSELVVVIHQAKHNDWEAFDEDKAMLFFSSQEDAEQAYFAHYDDMRFMGDVTVMSLEDFKAKVFAKSGEMIKSFLVDFSELSCGCSNDALETFSKALSEDQHDIWEPSNNPFISKLIELFTEKGLLKIDTIKTNLWEWLEKKRFTGIDFHISRKPGMMPIWSNDELELVKLYLESIPANDWNLEDYDYLVQYIFQRHMPAKDTISDVEWLTTKAHLMGKVQSVNEHFAKGIIDAAIPVLPSALAQANELFDFAKAELQIMTYAKLNAANLIVAMSDNSKAAVRGVILDHFNKKLSGDVTATNGKLQQALFDNFSKMNRDWRRIALTESNEAFGQGFISSLPVGSRVKRIEQYKGACQFCKQIDGLEFDVVDPNKPDKNDWTEMWEGKTNVGRSSSPYKKTDEGMVKRLAAEMWVPVPGAVHPHCRGRLVNLTAHKYAVSDEFSEWFKNHVKGK